MLKLKQKSTQALTHNYTAKDWIGDRTAVRWKWLEQNDVVYEFFSELIGEAQT